MSQIPRLSVQSISKNVWADECVCVQSHVYFCDGSYANQCCRLIKVTRSSYTDRRFSFQIRGVAIALWQRYYFSHFYTNEFACYLRKIKTGRRIGQLSAPLQSKHGRSHSVCQWNLPPRSCAHKIGWGWPCTGSMISIVARLDILPSSPMLLHFSNFK